jgi:phosphocarrier protein HPr
MKKAIVTVINEVGLHARPASILVQKVKKFQSKIFISDLTSNSKSVNAKSILDILSLGIEKGHKIILEVEGTDEEIAIQQIQYLIESDFKGYL